MNFSVEYLVAKSGDSRLLSYEYRSGVLKFRLKMDELDGDIEFEVVTPVVAGSAIEAGNDPSQTCFMEVVSLEEHMNVKNGIFVPSSDFGSFMKETRGKLHLAYGFRSSEMKVLLRLVGHEILLACPVRQLEKIRWHPL